VTKRLVALALFAASLAATSDARAFVRSRTDKGTPIYWPGSCVWLQPDSAGTTDLPLSSVLAVVTQSIANWQGPTLEAGCSYLKMILDAPAALEARLDHVNVIKFRTVENSPNGMFCRPADGSTAEICYSHSAAAITTVFYTSNPGASGDGSIVDADVELNDIDFTFVVCPAVGCSTNTHGRPGTMIADLENTLTHELGHFQGLDHTCWDHTNATDPIDNTGQPIPDCVDVTNHRVSQAVYDQITQATMYNYAGAGETIKRKPKPDDVAGICAIYPKRSDPMSCARPGMGGGGCSVEPGRAAGDGRALAALGGALIVLGLLARRRARRA
jgi:hypothetical protein